MKSAPLVCTLAAAMGEGALQFNRDSRKRPLCMRGSEVVQKLLPKSVGWMADTLPLPRSAPNPDMSRFDSVNLSVTR